MDNAIIGISGTDDVSPEFEIGITNGCDASTDMSVFTRLKPLLNIIITRNLSNPMFQSLLVQHKAKIILHYVVTGWGNTPMEQRTPEPRLAYEHLKHLISLGFPVEQIVLRVDPIIPNEQGLKLFALVLEAFANSGIKRLRYKMFLHPDSLLQRQRWHQVCMYVPNPYYNEIENKVYYTASNKYRNKVYTIIKQWEHQYIFESCDRLDVINTEHNTGCISMHDLRIMGISDIDVKPNLKKNRNCICPVNKRELMLETKWQCNLLCTHCYKPTKK